MATQLLTQSRAATARACQKLHQIKYTLGYHALVEIGALKFGALVHRGLEELWGARMRGDPCPLANALAAMQGESDPYELAKAEVLLTAYAARWPDDEYEALAVEVEFETELRNPETGAASRNWRLAGKIDVIVRERATARVLIVEHKTSSEDITPGSIYWQRLRMDGQVSVYFAGAASLGHGPAACLYDVIGKPGLRPLKATPAEARKYTKEGKLYANQREGDETPEEFRARLTEAVASEPQAYLARGEVVRLEAEMDSAMLDVWQLAQQLRESELAGRAPRNPDACLRYGRVCEFLSVCSGAASLDDTSLFRKSETTHPELSAQQQPSEVKEISQCL